MSELQDIIDQIVYIQKETLVAPSSEKDIAVATDELPVDLTLYPCFLNVEASTSIDYGAGGLREQHHEIDMNLVFSPSDKKYSMRSRRKWVQAVLDAFASRVTLNGTATQALITGVDYQTPLQWNDTPYMTATFRLAVEVKEAVDFTV
ncbi:hypothetical protein AMK68_00140 [candidate division KD3-62 bacterium DG_56]|uniref:Uncharacterized protein n=1 Tax=candidate division KD3-62 bacterium DG_56 TaxID=1704032 RepID=A0A0S7XQY4_9BACT|nr:MAG: hypothetical protein AMK68_00140 [candidate division KD3-62 bacterium DG_56]